MAELTAERVGLLERLAEVDSQISSELLVTPKSVAESVSDQHPTPVKRRGRPAGSAKGRKSTAGKNRDAEGNRLTLPAVLMEVLSKAKGPLTHDDLLKQVRHAGYHTKAGDFSNILYQAVTKLVREGKLTKIDDDKTRKYTLAA